MNRHSSVRMFDALSPHEFVLAEKLPAPVLEAQVFRTFNSELERELIHFNLFPPSFAKRLGYDEASGTIYFFGLIDGRTLGSRNFSLDPSMVTTLEPNVITGEELAKALALLSNPPAGSPWNAAGASVRHDFANALRELYKRSRLGDADPAGFSGATNWEVGLHESDSETWRPTAATGPGLALTTNLTALLNVMEQEGDQFDGVYVTLAENNSPSAAGNPVSMQVLRVVPDLADGTVVAQLPHNVFEEQLSLQMNLDFGGNSSYLPYSNGAFTETAARVLAFDWIYQGPDPDNPVFPQPPDSPDLENIAPWVPFPSAGEALSTAAIHLQDHPALLLTDWFFFSRYHPAGNRDLLSEWAGAANSVPIAGEYVPQLATGWVQRIVDAINPFENRYQDFTDTDAPEAWTSLIQQAGRPFDGDVALQDDPAYIQGVGLIELYQTVYNRALKLAESAIGSGVAPAAKEDLSQALLLAANRIAFLYRMLGDEAYSDALDPLIGVLHLGPDPIFPAFDSTPPVDQLNSITLPPTTFAFSDMLGSLKEEELALLRGRSLPGTGPTPSTGAAPVHNRLYWNFTGGVGEMAYSINYAIRDLNEDGFINAEDAAILYPQGHGDAWGQYLSALKQYYDVLALEELPWVSGPQPFALGEAVIEVDYWNERSFAAAASARQEAGLATLNRVLRKDYQENSPARWIGYNDPDRERAWGVDGWATRTGLAGLFDWATGNALLPAAPAPVEGSFTLTADGQHTGAIQIGANPQVVVDSVTEALNTMGTSAGAIDAVPGADHDPGLSFLVQWQELDAEPGLLSGESGGLEPASRIDVERVATGVNTAVELTGSGVDVQGNDDSFQFYHQPEKVEGEAMVEAYIASVGDTNQWTKAGVMVRESLAANSANAALFVTPEEGLTLQIRGKPGEGTLDQKHLPDVQAPVWLRLHRLPPDPDLGGWAFVHAYYSFDGIHWNLVGSTSAVELHEADYFGVAFTSHDAEESGRAVFDNMAVRRPDGAPTGEQAVSEWTFNAIGNPVHPGNAQIGTRAVQRVTLRQDGRQISVVDRGAVPDLATLSVEHFQVQEVIDRVNAGLNPLGLAPNAVPFDIDPSQVIAPSGGTGVATHFEQLYERALEAWRRAYRVLEFANIQKANLREVEATTEQLSLGISAKDFQLRNELIRLFGSPYEGLIGNGKPYPAGYVGPDYYFYNFIHNLDARRSVAQPSQNLVAFFQTFPVTAGTISDEPAGEGLQELFGTYFKNDLGDGRELLIPGEASPTPEFRPTDVPQTAGDFAFVAPTTWGQRSSPGQIQQALTRLVRVEAELQESILDYENHVDAIQSFVSLINARAERESDLDTVKTTLGKVQVTSAAVSKGLEQSASLLRFAGDAAKDAGQAVAEAFPLVVGTSDDVTSVLRAGALSVGSAISSDLRLLAAAADATAIPFQVDALNQEFAAARETLAIAGRFDLAEQLARLEDLLNQEPLFRSRVGSKVEELRSVSLEYQSIEAEALRLWQNRIGWNRKFSAAIQRQKTLDMAFRIERNTALRQYREAFDLAVRYAWLAAKAYDYDTSLPRNHPISAFQVMDEILQADNLGVLVGDSASSGVPVAGQGGLGQALDWLQTNYAQFKNQSGLNSPGYQNLALSLRHELARISQSDDKHWRQWLSGSHSSSGNGSVAFYYDLNTNPIYKTYCRPYADSPSEAVPGIVISFPSSVLPGQNFFGHPLQGGLSAYDPTRYATRVFSAGVEFVGYDIVNLSSTPRIYLVPTGRDISRVPGDFQGLTREFNVVEQRLPVAQPPSQGKLEDLSWSPSLDLVNGSFGQILRHSAFNAFTSPPDGEFDPAALNTETRLVGRSVWNTEWHVIIPLTSMHHIGSVLSTDGSSPDDVANLFREVDDIILHLQTYSLSGN